MADLRPVDYGVLLDQLALGICLVDRHHRLLLANAAARDLLARRDGLELADDLIEASAPADRADLRELLNAATVGAAWRLCTLARPSGLARLAVRIGAVSEGLRAIVFANPAEPAGFERAVRDLYKLTPAEARYAARIVEGGSLATIARAAGVTHNTVRTHIRRIFVKTGTRRQAELVRLLAQIGLLLPQA